MQQLSPIVYVVFCRKWHNINGFEKKERNIVVGESFRSMVSMKEMSERHCVMEVLGAIN